MLSLSSSGIGLCVFMCQTYKGEDDDADYNVDVDNDNDDDNELTNRTKSNVFFSNTVINNHISTMRSKMFKRIEILLPKELD